MKDIFSRFSTFGFSGSRRLGTAIAPSVLEQAAAAVPPGSFQLSVISYQLPVVGSLLITGNCSLFTEKGLVPRLFLSGWPAALFLFLAVF